MPLTAIIEGEEHPKKVTLVSDDEDGLNMTLIDKLHESEFTGLAERFEGAVMDEDGNLKVEIPPEDVGEVIDFLEFEFDNEPATGDLIALRQDAMDQAEAKLAGE